MFWYTYYLLFFFWHSRLAFMHVRIEETNAVNNPMYQGNDIEEDEITLDHATPLQEMVSCVLHTVNCRHLYLVSSWNYLVIL